MTTLSAAETKDYAQRLGFDFVGIVPAESSPTLDAYLRWIDGGLHGGMAYMARPDRVARRRDLTLIVPKARSLVIVGMDYGASVPPEVLTDPARGRIAMYAWGLDYHAVMGDKLEALAAALGIGGRVYVDTGAILERSHAAQAGLGFIGKNTMLIHPRRGSSFFIGEIVTDAAFDAYDEPLPRATMCGRCTRCLAACPTDAFPAPHVLDARRCISALTIEHKGSIPLDLRPRMSNWIFGCDLCQDACPFQRFARAADEPAFALTSFDRAAPLLLNVLALDEAAFQRRYAGSPVARIKRGRFVRNACVAAGNWGAEAAIPPLKRLLTDADALVRTHVGWALRQIMSDDARPLLSAAYDRESDADARAEWGALLEGRNFWQDGQVNGAV